MKVRIALLAFALAALTLPVSLRPNAAQQQPDFLVAQVDKYPAFIERRQEELEIESRACLAHTAHFDAGGVEWYAARDADPSCRNKRKTERQIERARDEFKARLCTGR